MLGALVLALELLGLGEFLAGGADLSGALDGGLELGGAAEGDVGEVTADGGDGLGGVGGLDAGGDLLPLLGGLVGVGAVLDVDLDFLLTLDADDGGLSLDEAGVALGGLSGVVEGIVGETDAVALLDVLVGAASEDVAKISRSSGHFFFFFCSCFFKN